MATTEKQKEYSKHYYEQHKDEILEWSRRHYQENRESIDERKKRSGAMKRYTEKNRDQIRERQRKAYAKNPEKYNTRYETYGRQWYLRNRERIKESQKIYHAEHRRQMLQKLKGEPASRILKICREARCRAKREGTDFEDPVIDYLVSLAPTVCPCCNGLLDYLSITRTGATPSIDRVNNTKGYTMGNVAIICWNCNSTKSDSSIEILEMLVAYMRTHAS